MQQLEDYLQVQLLDRSKRPFVLTSEGEQFYSGCCKIVAVAVRELAEEVRSLGQEISGRVTVAAIYSVGLSYMPKLQQLLKVRFPKPNFDSSFAILTMLSLGRARVGRLWFGELSPAIQNDCGHRLVGRTDGPGRACRSRAYQARARHT